MGRRRYRKRAKIGGGETLLLFAFIGYFVLIKVKAAVANLFSYIREIISQLTMFDFMMIFSVILALTVTIYYLNSIRKRKVEEIHKRNVVKEQQERKHKILLEAEANKLKTMHYSQFERYVADLFTLRGYEASVTPKTGDGGKDIILKKDNEVFIVECKRYNAPKVTRPDIQKFHSALIDMNAKEGYFVTTGYFTKPAMEYVLDKPIRLIDFPRLMEMIKDTKDIVL